MDDAPLSTLGAGLENNLLAEAVGRKPAYAFAPGEIASLGSDIPEVLA
jgi:hypothetical protein